MTIRELEEKDVSAVESIYDLYWTGDFRIHASERLKDYVNHSPKMIEQGFKYLVAEDNNEIVGVAVYRKCPDHMKQYTKTDNPVEFYILAVKYKNKGTGTTLLQKEIEETKQLGYTEAILYSSNSHQDSWGFYDKSEFKRVSEAIAPNGEKGFIWRMEF